MKPSASMELMKSVMENELLLDNIFSFLDLDTVKIVRLVNTKWKRVARKTFSEISLVFIHLMFDWDMETRLKLMLNRTPVLTLRLGDDIKSALKDQLACFKNFKVEFSLLGHVLSMESRLVDTYSCLNQLLRHIWRPKATLIHSLSHFFSVPKDLFNSIMEACNSFSHVEIEAREYVRYNRKEVLEKCTYEPVKMTCHTLRIRYDVHYCRNKSRAICNFVNTKKIIFSSGYDGQRVSLESDVHAIIERGEQYGQVEEIEVALCQKFEEVRALAGLRSGLKRLRIRIVGAETYQNVMLALQECIARHAPTLEFLNLEFVSCRIMADLRKFDSDLKFPKLKRLWFETYLTFGEVEPQDVDVFHLIGAVENETLRTRFPALKRVEIVEPPNPTNSILLAGQITEPMLSKYGVKVVIKQRRGFSVT